MNYKFANEECSSGCESGWTLYLEHSYNHQENDYLDERRNGVFTEAKRLKKREEQEEDEEDEDLSMVSDASSGPPHLHEDQSEGYGGINHDNVNGCFYHYNVEEPLLRNGFNTKKNRENRHRKDQIDQSSSLLDDTASSPFFDFSVNKRQTSVENVLECSQGYSTTQFVRPQYDFFQSSPLRNQLQQNQWFGGKMW